MLGSRSCLVRGLIVPTIMAMAAQSATQAESPAADAGAGQAYFATQVANCREQTARELAAVTAENWPELRAQWRRELQEMLGLDPWPERTDPQVTVVGSVERPGVTVQRLHYQSRPGLYVPANLYRPAGDPPAQGWPAVLYVCGHARVEDGGRLLGNKTSYQHHGLWLARHGVVCLMIDTIQLGEMHGEHHGTYRLGRWDWMGKGYTPAGVEAWNALRGVDLLQSLEFVDGDRLGITGRSGGGAYSWFAAALDDRIQVAVPVAGITDLQNYLLDGCVSGHCDCMFFINYYAWDYPKLAALVAPRALLLANTDRDRLFPLDGVFRTHAQLESLYRRLGATDHYGLLVSPGPHQDGQELQVGAFRWLLRQLTGSDPVIDSAALKEIEPRELVVFPQELPKDERVTSVSQWFVGRLAPAAVEEESAKQASSEGREDPILTPLQRIGAIPTATAPVVGVREIAVGQAASWAWRLLHLEAASLAPAGSPVEPPAIIRLLQVEPAGRRPREQRTVLHLTDPQQSAWDDPAHRSAFLSAPSTSRWLSDLPDHRHYFVQWRGAGWLTRSGSVKDQTNVWRRFYLLGQSPHGLLLRDALATAAWLHGGAPGHAALPAGQRPLSEIDWAGSGAEAWLASLAGWASRHLPQPLPGAGEVYLQSPLRDPTVAAVLPGAWRFLEIDQLLDERASQAFHGLKLVTFAADLPAAYPVDTAAEPQQATGIKIVEVGPDRAIIWARATRWPLPNLGDLPPLRFSHPAPGNSRRHEGPLLPERGVADLPHAVPGVPAELRLVWRAALDRGAWQESDWTAVDETTDFSTRFALPQLLPGTAYEIQVQARGRGEERTASTVRGSFTTLPAEDAPADFKLAMTTGQAFVDRDGPHGFDLYRTMLARGTDAFIMAGDVVYYDALARSSDLAHYHWQRTYSLPTLLTFHRQVPTWFLKDDHDVYVNDCWPGQRHDWTGEFTFEDGQRIFRQQTGLPDPPYRTFRVGQDLQFWLLEGRDFRSPNDQPDRPGKTIWGQTQKEWLQQTVEASPAAFRVIVSPTPIVGPDRDSKADNHANRAFATEGSEVRQWLASQPGTLVICGDRHWQYHSVDPHTGLHEFSAGPASQRHAGGWNPADLRPDYHRFLRVGGGYLELEIAGPAESRQLTFRHLDPYGREHYAYTVTRPPDQPSP